VGIFLPTAKHLSLAMYSPVMAGRFFWRSFSKASRRDDEESFHAQDVIAQACIKVAQDHGLDPTKGIESPTSVQIPLLEAA